MLHGHRPSTVHHRCPQAPWGTAVMVGIPYAYLWNALLIASWEQCACCCEWVWAQDAIVHVLNALSVWLYYIMNMAQTCIIIFLEHWIRLHFTFFRPHRHTDILCSILCNCCAGNLLLHLFAHQLGGKSILHLRHCFGCSSFSAWQYSTNLFLSCQTCLAFSCVFNWTCKYTNQVWSGYKNKMHWREFRKTSLWIP